MSLITILPIQSPSPSPTTPLRHPAHRSHGQKAPSPSFIDRWRDRMRSDLAAKLKSARAQATNDARGGDEEVLSLIFRAY